VSFSPVFLNFSNIGNIWLNSTNGGFSQICDDLDNDSICDSNYTLQFGQVDFFPQKSLFLYPVEVSSVSSPVSITSLPSIGFWSSVAVFTLVLMSLVL
jgi:hypothetical protein